MDGGFSRFLIGDKYKPEDMHHNIKIEQPTARIITPSGIAFEAGEFSPVVSWELRDEKGKLVDRMQKKADSFLANFIRLMRCQMAGEAFHFPSLIVATRRAKLIVKNTAGVEFFPFVASLNMNSHAAIGDATLGLVVGTDNTPVAFDDYTLGTVIAHGVGAGQLQYSVTSYGAPTSDGTTSQFRFTRVFSNGSGGAINVNEAGIIGYVSRGISELGTSVTWGAKISESLKVLLLRDILPGAPVAVPNGNSLTVNYQPQAVV